MQRKRQFIGMTWIFQKNYRKKGGEKAVKKKVALLLITCMVLSSLGLTFGANASDIKDHWAKGIIETWISNGFISGYPDGSFRPNNSITRAEFMVLVNKAFGFTERAEISYKDVSESQWYYNTVARATAAGYMGGYPDGSMKPNHPISRQEVSVVLSKLTNMLQNPSAINSFTDASDITNWAKGYVGATAAKGYMRGYPDGSFKPTNNITRAEAVATLNKALTVEADEEEQEEKDAAEIVYDEAGTYGPRTGTTIITKDVIVKAEGVTLENMVIEGSLTIAEEVGDGDVNLNNITVKGETFIRGGGKDSIHINGGEYNKIIVQKTSSGNVRITATNEAGIEIIISEAAEGQTIILEGSFEGVIIEADNINLIIQGETNIDEVIVKRGTNGTLVSLGNDATITNLAADARIEVQGQGIIKEASGKEIRNSTFEKAPERITSPSSGGGGGGGSSIVAVGAITVTGDAGVGIQLTATPTPSGATVNYQWERADTIEGSYIDIHGATASTYNPIAGDVGKFIRVIARGTGGYTGTVTSAATAAVEEAEWASTNAPTVVSVVYGTSESVAIAELDNIVGIKGIKGQAGTATIDWTISNYDGDTLGNYAATGVLALPDGWIGNPADVTTIVSVVEKEVTAIGAIIEEGLLLRAGALVPVEATVKYQWQRHNGVEWINIDGANENIYRLSAPVEIGNQVRVVIRGTGNYAGTVESDPVTIE